MIKNTFECYVDHAGKWRWRQLANNGNIVSDSSQGYANKRNLKRAVERATKLLVPGTFNVVWLYPSSNEVKNL